MRTTVRFFLQNTASVEILLDTFKVFSDMSGLLLNENKCEIATVGKLGDSSIIEIYRPNSK